MFAFYFANLVHLGLPIYLELVPHSIFLFLYMSSVLCNFFLIYYVVWFWVFWFGFVLLLFLIEPGAFVSPFCVCFSHSFFPHT